eukprot:TRINITY_DN1315_c0_g1_i1.p1 TRINITY_DN1315_c0_g1~~TRINITY_DN1315_c0_g1_i1.p1  ORF type:complete len:450 (+),score=118.27 TRINITY_DN1315_c0_g1_i1:51-1352(+)
MDGPILNEKDELVQVQEPETIQITPTLGEPEKKTTIKPTIVITESETKQPDGTRGFRNKQFVPEAKLIVSQGHLKERIPEIYAAIDLSGIEHNHLLEFIPTVVIREEDSHWKEQYQFADANYLVAPIKTIVDYCISGGASEDIQNKFKTIIKVLKEQKDNKQFSTVGVLAFLAAHGNMCNVQKEIGIRLAYGFVTDSMKVDFEKETLHSYLLRLLYTLRELVCEKVFIRHIPQHNYGMNSHYIVPFRNGMADQVGLDQVPDVNFPAPLVYESQVPQFFEEYTVELIVKTIKDAINQKPKKIPYEVVLTWLELNRPKEYENDGYGWLEEAFDEETGELKEQYVLYMLLQNNILLYPDEADQREKEIAILVEEAQKRAVPKQKELPKFKPPRNAEVELGLDAVGNPWHSKLERVIHPPKFQLRVPKINFKAFKFW